MNNSYLVLPRNEEKHTLLWNSETLDLKICFPAVRALSCITNNISQSNRISSQGTNIFSFIIIFFKSCSCWILCMSTKWKHNLRKISRNNTISFSHFSPLILQLTAAAVERRGEIIHLAGFSYLLIFLCNGAGLKRRDTESEELLTSGTVARSVEKPAHLHLTSHSSHTRPTELLSVLRSFASRLGYRTWMSWLMDTKQRCPWWWRELGKLESIPGF